MRVRRGIFRLLLLATLGWAAFVAYNAWGTVPRAVMPVVATQLQDDCRFSFRVTSDMNAYVVRREAVAQYRRARTSARDGRCRNYQQLSEDQVGDIADRAFAGWLGAQRAQFEREHGERLKAWIYAYLLRALGPPLVVWILAIALFWIGRGSRRSEA
ncbi:MAG: hypothetical protein GC190_21740 [Alphaproteobacteria bacterium]|nr:hypothetical protein [Alphaproteobacteria bacterium]